MIAAYQYVKLMILLLISIFLFAGCNNQSKEKKPGQALVSVNDHEITMHQLNDELKHAGIRAEEYEAASKQLLESLIARQLIVDEAIRVKIDRTPEVMQARERANAQIIAQAYLKNIVNKVAKPSRSDIEEYFYSHPEYFAQRKQFDLTVLRLTNGNVDVDLKAIINEGKSLNEIINWLDKKNVEYVRHLTSRSTTDLPLELAVIMRENDKNRVFVITEKGNDLLISINAIKENPITLKNATPFIEKYLMNRKVRQNTDAEIERLRSLAKIEYLNVKTKKMNSEGRLVDQQMHHNANSTGNLNLSDRTSEELIERAIMELK
ncbi:MAG: peptidyl-prolyl cis-trans isomerase, EpsD family [Nitrosomonas sp. PRO4]|nr:peptidyl-prolyl cis-trans isomerase, EpsD family [Nitrosomonas sp. PRO4]